MDTDTKPHRRSPNAPTTVSDIAAHKDAIAAFAYAVGHDGTHTLVERNGITSDTNIAGLWVSIAAHVAAIGGESLTGEHVRVVIGDAQVVWYVRDGRFAVVVVILAGSPFIKSVLRMSRRALRTMQAADEVEHAQHRAVAAVAVARDLGAIR